jgi:hypothetical protein
MYARRARARTLRWSLGLGAALGMMLGVAAWVAPALAADRISGSVDTRTPEVGLSLKVTISGNARPGESLDAAAFHPGEVCPSTGPIGVVGFFLRERVHGRFRLTSHIRLPSNPSGDGPGRWRLCLYLSRNDGDLIAASTTVPFVARGPREKMSLAFSRRGFGRGFHYKVTTTSDQDVYLPIESIVAQPLRFRCAASFAADLSRKHGNFSVLGRADVRFGTASLVFRGPRSGTWRICGWVEGPPAGDVEARANKIARLGADHRPRAFDPWRVFSAEPLTLLLA